MNLKEQSIYSVPLVQPIITSYPDIANHLALAGNYVNTEYHDYYMNWLIVQYINFRIQLPWDTPKMGRGYNILLDDPYNTNRIFETNILQKHCHHMHDIKGDFSNFVISNLKNGYAVHTWANRRHILNIDMDFKHEVLIHTYKPGTETFIVYDFFDNSKYQSKEVAKKNLDIAFSSYVDVYYDDRLTYRDTHSFAVRPFKTGEIEFSPVFQYEKERLVHLLVQYIKGAVYGDRVCGSMCYAEILRQINSVPLLQFDRRVLHLLYEHKVMLKTMVEYLVQTKKIVDSEELLKSSKNLVDMMLACRNLYMKYAILEKSESDFKKKIHGNLVTIKDFEKDMLYSLCESIYAG